MACIARSHAERIFDDIFKDIKGYDLSFAARTKLEPDDSFTYGEVTLAAMEELLRHIPNTGVMYDLGSGVGKAAIALGLLANFSVIRGVEIIPELAAASEEARRRFVLATEPLLLPGTERPQIEFILADFVAIDFSDADFVFVPSTCYTETLMSMIRRRATMLRPGAYLATVSRTLQSTAFELRTNFSVPMSWGESTIFLYQRR